MTAPAPTAPRKIVSLTAENVKRLTAVHIEPNGESVVIGGKNAQGKSSILDAIFLALGGKAGACDKPIRDGAETAEVRLDLGDLVVIRTWTAAGTYLTVKNREGAKFASPQDVLDRLCSMVAFDPMAFTRMPAAKQAEVLREVSGLDLTALDKQIAEAEEARKLTGRDAKQARGAADSMTVPAGAPAEAVSVVKLAEALEAERAKERAKTEAVNATDMMERRRIEQQGKIAAAKKQLAEWEAAAITKEAVDAAYDKVAAMPSGKVEAAAEALRQSEAHNAAHAARVAKEAANKKAARLETDYAVGTEKIEMLRAARANAIAAAPMPVKGLGIDEQGRATLNGIPFSQASAAEQIRVSMAMGLASNPGIRVVLIRDGSLLDEDSLRLVAEAAKENDAQVWIERVGAGQEVQVVISDGGVIEDRLPKVEKPAPVAKEPMPTKKKAPEVAPVAAATFEPEPSAFDDLFAN